MRARRLVALLCVCVALPCGLPAPAAGQTPVTAFVDVTVVPMDRERVLPRQTVVIQGDRITTLGPVAKVKVPAGATRVDGRGKYLIPGLADMHVHALRADSLTIADLMFVYVANGITTIRDMHSGNRRTGAGAWGLGLKRKLARGEILGPRLYTAGDPDSICAEDTECSPGAAARNVAELKADGYDFLKISFTPRIARWPAMQPVYDSMIAVARRVGLPVVGHVPPGVDVTQIAAPWVSTEHLYEYTEYLLGVNGRWSRVDDESTPVDTSWMQPAFRLPADRLHQLTSALKRSGVWSCPTLMVWKSVLSFPNPGTATPHFKRYLEFDLQIVKALQDAGAGLLLGTDRDPYAIHGELAALVEAGLTPYQALATGTRNVAQFLGALDSTGTVAVGKRADLVLLSGNPLQDISYTGGPAGVMVGGRWLPRSELDSRLASVDTSAGSVKGRARYWRH